MKPWIAASSRVETPSTAINPLPRITCGALMIPAWSACSSKSCAASSMVLFEERDRSEEHTSELQSRSDLVCRLLLEKKNIASIIITCVGSGCVDVFEGDVVGGGCADIQLI